MKRPPSPLIAALFFLAACGGAAPAGIVRLGDGRLPNQGFLVRRGQTLLFVGLRGHVYAHADGFDEAGGRFTGKRCKQGGCVEADELDAVEGVDPARTLLIDARGRGYWLDPSRAAL